MEKHIIYMTIEEENAVILLTGKAKLLLMQLNPPDGRLYFDDDENFAVSKWKFCKLVIWKVNSF